MSSPDPRCRDTFHDHWTDAYAYGTAGMTVSIGNDPQMIATSSVQDPKHFKTKEITNIKPKRKEAICLTLCTQHLWK